MFGSDLSGVLTMPLFDVPSVWVLLEVKVFLLSSILELLGARLRLIIERRYVSVVGFRLVVTSTF